MPEPNKYNLKLYDCVDTRGGLSAQDIYEKYLKTLPLACGDKSGQFAKLVDSHLSDIECSNNGEEWFRPSFIEIEYSCYPVVNEEIIDYVVEMEDENAFWFDHMTCNDDRINCGALRGSVWIRECNPYGRSKELVEIMLNDNTTKLHPAIKAVFEKHKNEKLIYGTRRPKDGDCLDIVQMPCPFTIYALSNMLLYSSEDELLHGEYLNEMIQSSIGDCLLGKYIVEELKLMY